MTKDKYDLVVKRFLRAVSVAVQNTKSHTQSETHAVSTAYMRATLATHELLDIGDSFNVLNEPCVFTLKPSKDFPTPWHIENYYYHNTEELVSCTVRTRLGGKVVGRNLTYPQAQVLIDRQKGTEQ